MAFKDNNNNKNRNYKGEVKRKIASDEKCYYCHKFDIILKTVYFQTNMKYKDIEMKKDREEYKVSKVAYGI